MTTYYHVYKYCHECNTPFEVLDLASRLTSKEQKRFSDGTTETWCSTPERFIRCGFCEEILDAKELKITKIGVPKIVNGVLELDEHNYHQLMPAKALSCFKLVMATSDLPLEESHHILVNRWHQINHDRSQHRDDFNYDQLFLVKHLADNALTRTIEQHITQAELYRELKRFDDCLAIIKHIKATYSSEQCHHHNDVIKTIEWGAQHQICEVLSVTPVERYPLPLMHDVNRPCVKGWMNINEIIRTQAINHALSIEHVLSLSDFTFTEIELEWEEIDISLEGNVIFCFSSYAFHSVSTHLTIEINVCKRCVFDENGQLVHVEVGFDETNDEFDYSTQLIVKHGAIFVGSELGKANVIFDSNRRHNSLFQTKADPIITMLTDLVKESLHKDRSLLPDTFIQHWENTYQALLRNEYLVDLSSNPFSQGLLDAFMQSQYVINDIPSSPLIIGKHNVEVDDLLKRHNSEYGIFITAWNPYSRQMSEQDNDHKQSQLIASIDNTMHHVYDAIGQSQDKQWQESSLFITNMTLEQGHELAKQYGQLGFVCHEVGEMTQLVLSDLPNQAQYFGEV